MYEHILVNTSSYMFIPYTEWIGKLMNRSYILHIITNYYIIDCELMDII